MLVGTKQNIIHVNALYYNHRFSGLNATENRPNLCKESLWTRFINEHIM